MPRVLIVDDHPEALYLLRCVLGAQGFVVVEAANGHEALERARGQAVDLIVSDILMPGMDIKAVLPRR
jgi:two-component system, OmpR family, response regulator SaeR